MTTVDGETVEDEPQNPEESPPVDPEESPPVIGPDPSTQFRLGLAHDILNVFLDLEFFGETHYINGHPAKVVIDEDIQKAGFKGYGVNVDSFLLFVRESDLDRPSEGDQVDIDGRLYTVETCRLDEGLFEIVLRRPTAY